MSLRMGQGCCKIYNIIAHLLFHHIKCGGVKCLWLPKVDMTETVWEPKEQTDVTTVNCHSVHRVSQATFRFLPLIFTKHHNK